MNISIFAKPIFFKEDPGITTGSYLHRAASLIRGEQIAQFLGGKYNPTEGYENDVCIYLKPRTLDHIKDGSFVDFSDCEEYLIGQLQSRSKIKVITSALYCFESLRKRLKNEMFLIPEHHCNFERIKRSRKEFTTGGIIASPSTISFAVNDEIRKRLEKIGLKFITYYDWRTRQDAVNFFKQIDFQVVIYSGSFNDYDITRHPNKLINAASYGIPTLSKWKAGYKEFEGSYILIQGIEDMILEAEKLKNKDYYKMWSDKVTLAAESYHIENVAKLYRQLT